MIRRLLLLAALALSVPALGQTVTITSPNTVNPAGQPKQVADVFVRNADGTIATVSGGGGTDPRVAQSSTTAGQTGTLTQCAVVSGDQAYTPGQTNPCNLTPSGRLKVGLSSAGNVDPAAQPATTLAADLVACKNRASSTFSAGFTGALACDTAGNLLVNNATLPPGAATSANQPSVATNAAASPTTGTLVMGSDGTNARALSITSANGNLNVAAAGDKQAGTADSGYPVKIGGYANSATPTAVTAGQRVNSWFDLNGRAVVSLGTISSISTARANVLLGTDPGGNLLPFGALGYVYNGTNAVAAPGDTTGSYVIGQPVATASAGVAPVATTVAASSQVIKASAGNLYSLNVTSAASAGYVMVFNATTAPADGTVTPAKCLPLAANTGLDLNFRAAPTFFSTGIAVVFSTTGCFTKTASATAFISGDAK